MSPWCPYSEPGSTVPPNTFRRHFVIRQQYTHLTHFIIIKNLHLHDRGSVGSSTSVRLTLGVHSMANSVKNAGSIIRVGRNAQAEEPVLEPFSRINERGLMFTLRWASIQCSSQFVSFYCSLFQQ